MKTEKIIKDGKIIGLKKVFETGDKFPEQFGEFIYLDKEPTAKDYEDLSNKVLQQMFEHIKDSGKVWNFDGLEVVLKSKEEIKEGYPLSHLFPEDKIGTLGVKVTISRIVEEGENL